VPSNVEPAAKGGRKRRPETWYERAQKRWPDAAWILGNPLGSCCYVVLSTCKGGPRVSLWGSLSEARSAKSRIDRHGCSRRCQKQNHRVGKFSELAGDRATTAAATAAAVNEQLTAKGLPPVTTAAALASNPEGE
jgi:hypothetical protein